MKKFGAILLLSIFLFGARVGAQNQSELEREMERIKKNREELIEEQKKLEAELNEVNRQSQSLGAAVKNLDSTRRKINADINITKSKITSTQLTIKTLENTMTEKEKEIITHRFAIKESLSALSEYDTRPFILNLASYGKLSDLWQDRGELESLNNRLNNEITDLRETKKILSDRKTEKEKVKREQMSLADQLSGQRSVVEENQKAKEKLLKETKNKESEYQKLLRENIANQKQFEEDLYRLESALKISIDKSLYPRPAHGILSWPLDKVFVTQKFGDTDFARSGAYDGRGHNGIDFRATMGTPIKAMLTGTIEGTGNTDEKNAELRLKGEPICGSYGRWVLIKHPNGLSSVYAHLSAVIVLKGQNIETGDVIGYSGGMPGVNGSGYSTGPHLHAGLFVSQGVEVRQFTNSKHCKHVSVPVADLKAYLDPLAYLPSL